LIFWLLSGCAKPDEREITVSIQAHTLPSCPLPVPARLDLAALGDFPISNRTSESLAIDASGTNLGFPQDTLALAATANADLAQVPFIGYGELASQRIDFLLWPQGTACDVFRPSSTDSFPGTLGGEALGYSNTSGLVMVAGSNDATSAAIVGALTFDTRSGENYVVDPRKRQVLSEPRAFATVTDFAGKLLVAGGENPIHDPAQPASVLRSSAEVYDPATQSFEPDLIMLADATTHHAATTLDNGESVLVGGRNEISNASNVVQAISPTTRVSKLLEPLGVGRNDPTALHLDDGRILVAGGNDQDGHPVGALEWRDVDASQLPLPFDGSTSLPPRFDRAFVALPGGAALAVGGCEDRPPNPGEDCAQSCNRGCAPTPDPQTQQSYDAFWLASDGSVTRLDFAHEAPEPVLIQGSDGRPWLIATAEDDSGNAIAHSLGLYRFDPWQKRFDAVDLDLGLNQTTTALRVVATGPDAFVWLGADDTGTVVRGVRIGTRSRFASDVPLVSLPDGVSRPAHLAPDHVPDGTVSYDAAGGTLTLSAAGAAPNCVWITDAEYGDFSAQISFSSATPPNLRFGTHSFADPNSPDSTPCQLPSVESTNGGKLDFRRTGTSIAINLGGVTSSCKLTDESERSPFAICQSELGSVTVTELAVTRGD
jgi:hypothetical protein